MPDTKLSALAAISVPALADPIYGEQSGVSGQYLLNRLLGQIGIAQAGRLTLTSGLAITTSDVTAAGTIYYTPYLHDRVRIYDGTRWRIYALTELSLALTVTSGKVYDVFIYDNAGTLTLELSAAWTNDTTRADALGTQDGVPVKSSNHTRLWIGTIYASGTNTTEDSALNRYVSNAYNAVLRAMDTGVVQDIHTYTTNAYREWHGGTNSVRLNFVSARGQSLGYSLSGQITGVTAGSAYMGANIDISSTIAGAFIGTSLASQVGMGLSGYLSAAPGKHAVYPIQYGTTGASFVNYGMACGVMG